MSRIVKRDREQIGGPAAAHRKSWGHEFWIENCAEYCGKMLSFDGPGATSMHFHVEKLETMFLLQGRVVIDLVDPENAEPYTVELEPGDAIQIPRFQAHSIRALTRSDVLEFSTHHRDEDSFRVAKGRA